MFRGGGAGVKRAQRKPCRTGRTAKAHHLIGQYTYRKLHINAAAHLAVLVARRRLLAEAHGEGRQAQSWWDVGEEGSERRGGSERPLGGTSPTGLTDRPVTGQTQNAGSAASDTSRSTASGISSGSTRSIKITPRSSMYKALALHVYSMQVRMVRGCHSGRSGRSLTLY